MGRAPRSRLAIVFLMIFTVGLTLGLPAEDVLDAVYDESEALPFEAIPLFSTMAPLPDGLTAQVPPRSVSHEVVVPSPRVCDAEACLPTHTRVSLALICTRLC